jgi:hypothetical protein
MTEEQDAATYSQLLAILRASGLAWVADQVDAEVAAGRLERVRVSPVREEEYRGSATILSDRFTSRQGPPAAYLKALPYSSGQRVRLLADAIEQAVVRTIEMQSDALIAFKDQLASAGIIFAAQEPDTDIHLAEAPSPGQLESVASLQAALRRLRDLTSD